MLEFSLTREYRPRNLNASTIEEIYPVFAASTENAPLSRCFAEL
jgi:hypothetical protein